MTTMTEPVVGHQWRGPWTIDDLADTPDDGNRYEIFDGSLLVSPAPHVPHAKAVLRLRRLIEAHKPAHIEVAENIGLQVRAGRSYFIPDLIVVLVSALDRSDAAFKSPDALLVVEVMSKGNSKIDLVMKRHEYAAAAIPQYWIVSEDDRTLTVLTRPEQGKGYLDQVVVKAGERFEADDPFPISLDPADFC
jgi:Uma2 family endonuclease